MEIQLPSDTCYSAGDYLAILPLNLNQNIIRAMRRFQLAWDAHITISTDGQTILPTNISVLVNDIFGAYVELAQPATKRVRKLASHYITSDNCTHIQQSILVLAESTQDVETKKKLRALASNKYSTDISIKWVSILDLLDQYPSVTLPFGTFLSFLPPIRVC